MPEFQGSVQPAAQNLTMHPRTQRWPLPLRATPAYPEPGGRPSECAGDRLTRGQLIAAAGRWLLLDASRAGRPLIAPGSLLDDLGRAGSWLLPERNAGL